MSLAVLDSPTDVPAGTLFIAPVDLSTSSIEDEICTLVGQVAAATWDYDGSLVIHGCLSPEDGALFIKAVQMMADSVETQVTNDADSPANARRADAVVHMAQTALASGAKNCPERYQTNIDVAAEALSFDGDGACAMERGPAIAPETARRLSCDSSFVTMMPCDSHHRCVHEGAFSVLMVDGQPIFRDRDGNVIAESPSMNSPGPLDVPAGTCGSSGGGGRFDLSMTVDVLLQANPTPQTRADSVRA